MTKLCLICGAVFDGETCPKCGEGSFESVAVASQPKEEKRGKR